MTMTYGDSCDEVNVAISVVILLKGLRYHSQPISDNIPCGAQRLQVHYCLVYHFHRCCLGLRLLHTLICYYFLSIEQGHTSHTVEQQFSTGIRQPLVE